VETSSQPERRYVQGGLPWLIAGVALVTYGATLNHWLTLSSLPVTAGVSGWSAQPMLFQPVLFLLTLPLRWVPAGWAPLATNLFTAACACLTLALLARSVALLPQDRLEQQRLLVQNEQGLLTVPGAWVPPVLAAAALGLQRTFWENAIAASGDMLDLLLFASVIWCVLEYRCAHRRCWLDWAALLCGLAVANGWGMIGFVPLLAVALIRSRRLRFFNVRYLERVESSAWRKAMPALAEDGRFFLRMALLGLAGLSLLLLLPAVHALSTDSSLNLWQALRAVATSYCSTLVFFFGKVLWHHRELALLLAAVSLVPLLLLSIRWGDTSGQRSGRRLDPMLIALLAAHAFLLLVCVFAAFDPPFSPRQLGRRLGLGLPFLRLDYLGALCIGYYSGFFLLIFRGYLDRRSRLPRAVGWAAPKLVYALLGLTLAGLLWENLPVIQMARRVPLERYAGLMLASLPAEGAVVCSQDPTRLTLLRAWLAREGKAERYVPVDLTVLQSERYQATLRKRYPKRWPEPERVTHSVETNALQELVSSLRLLARLVQSNRVCCLEPDYRFLAEQFDFRPRGLAYELKLCGTNSFMGPPLDETELTANGALWKRMIETGVDPLVRMMDEAERSQHGLGARVMAAARLTRPLPDTALALALGYSSALDVWGVTLQRQERWKEATSCFVKALALNPANLAARVNLMCNSNRLAGLELTRKLPKSLEDQLGKYRNYNQLLGANGPFDEPACCYQLGAAFAQDRLFRQAGQNIERAQALVPKDAYARMLLGELWNRCGRFDKALQVANQVRSDPALQPLGDKEQIELAFLEAEAWFGKTNRAKAEGLVQSLLDAHSQDPAIQERAKIVFTAFGSYTNALRITEQQLQVAPNNLPALLDKGLLLLLARDFSNSIPTFTHVLSLTNHYSTRINRALAYLQTGQWDSAEADYQATLKAFPDSYQPYYGLGEVALRRGNTNAAVGCFQRYLAGANTNLDEFKVVTARLQSLRPQASKH
jgi:tetratricopeptide (TPR) repeat protein